MLAYITALGSSPSPLGADKRPDARATSIPSLTGIRGVAALMVVLYHMPLSTMYHLATQPIVIRNSSYGVELFFILSGFILAHVHMHEFRQLTTRNIGRFLALRFFRVYPVHLVVLLVIAAWVTTHHGFVLWVRSLPNQKDAFTLGAFLQTLTLTNRIGLPSLGEYNGPSWSLSSEIVGYLFFPLLACTVVRSKSVMNCFVYVVTSLLVFCAVIYSGHGGIARMILCFPAGVVVARIFNLLKMSPKQASLLTKLSASIVLITLTFDSLSSFCVFGFSGVILGLSYSQKGIISQFLASPLVFFLGKISFSLYLIHLVLQWAMVWSIWNGRIDTAQPTVALFGILAASLLAGTLIYYTVEAPAHRFGRNFARRFTALEH